MPTALETLKNNHCDLPTLMGNKQKLNSFGWHSREFIEATHLIAGSCDVSGYLDEKSTYWHDPVVDKDTLGTTNMCGLMVLEKILAYVEIYQPHTVWFSCARLLPDRIVNINGKEICLYPNSQRLIRFLHAKRLISREERESFLNSQSKIDNSTAVDTFVKSINYLGSKTNLVWMPTATPEAQEYWNHWLQKMLNHTDSNKYVTDTFCGRVFPIDENPDNTIGPETRKLVYDSFRHFKSKLRS